ncbi:LOW QUALITY PROTEIN: hypothetical protein Bca4012_080871 [Brassica carinata]
MDYASATTTKVSMHIDDEDDEEEEEEVCRICRNPGDVDTPLRYPCACNGSIKFVHEDCLLQWLSYSKSRHCEVCKHSFSFSPLYAGNAPTRLPFHEFAVGVAMKACSSRVPRLSLVVSVWLLAVLASNMLFIGAVIFVPFTLGWVILYYFGDTGLSLRNIALSLNNVLTAAVSNLINKGGQENGLLEMVKVKVNGSELSGAINTLFVAAGLSSTLYDVTTLTVGYMFIVFLVLIYLGITALIRYFKDEPLTLGGICRIVETVSPLLSQFLVVMRLASFVVVMFGVFPLMCGWLLDVCTVTMFGQTMSYRLQFLSVSPLASSLVHWVVGAVYDWYSLIFENLLREVIRPEVLYFLYGPEDDEEETIRYLVHDPVHKIARDGFLSGAQYGSWIVLLVFLPVKLAIWMAPSVFPLDISVSDPYTEVPAGILLLTICTPFIIEHFSIQTTVVSLLRCWFTCVGWALGLTDFLLLKPEDNRNDEPGRQNIEQVLHVVEPDMAMAAHPAPDDPKRSLLQEYAVKHVKSERTSVLLNQIWKWCGIVIKSSVLLGIWSKRRRLQGLWVLREIVLSVVMKLLTALCVPYVLARGVFPMLGCPLVVNSAVYRFAWIGCLSASLLCFCAKRCQVWFRNLHNSIRDDRYIIGQRLHNSGEEAAALAIKKNQSSEVAGDGGLRRSI